MPNADQLTAEQILIDHGVGKCIQPQNEGWDKKKSLYKREKVWALFVRNRGAYKDKFTNPITQTTDNVNANKAAQIEVDNHLFAKIRGLLPEIALDDPADDQLVSREMFGDNLNAQVDHIESVDYIYLNFGFKDNKPEDAPNSGAYFHLKRLQNDKEEARDFFKTTWPKTIPSKSVIEDARKRHDDGRDTFELLDRISRSYDTDQE